MFRLPRALAVLIAVSGPGPAAAAALPGLAQLVAVARRPQAPPLEVVALKLNLGPGFVIDEWVQKAPDHRIVFGFSRLTNDAQAFELSISRSAATLTELAPTRRALYRVTSAGLGDVTEVWRVLSGPFQNRYLQRTTFPDASVNVTVVDQRYLLASGRRWAALGTTVPDAETTYAYLNDKARFCQMPRVHCFP